MQKIYFLLCRSWWHSRRVCRETLVYCRILRNLPTLDNLCSCRVWWRRVAVCRFSSHQAPVCRSQRKQGVMSVSFGGTLGFCCAVIWGFAPVFSASGCERFSFSFVGGAVGACPPAEGETAWRLLKAAMPLGWRAAPHINAGLPPHQLAHALRMG